MLAIGDQATDDARIGKRRADHARRTRRQLAHRVIEMGGGARAGVKDGLRFFRACVRMAEADDNSGFRQASYKVQRDRRGRERHDHHARAPRDEGVGVFFFHRADEFGRVHALALGIDERPFDMDAERARNAFARLARGRERFGKHMRRVGHHRRQESSHASAAMRGGDRGYSVNCRIGVEQHAAAAVDLPIDEAWTRESRRRGRVARRRWGGP